MESDDLLLRAFVERRSERAFAELVQRHIDLVHSAALRQLAGDGDLARDATQKVFCELAQKAPSLLGKKTLSGWLYTTARFVAARLRRAEIRRVHRDQAYSIEHTEEVSSEANWSELQVLLDEAMAELPAKDREAVILRYFRGEPLSEVARCLGSSENAARMKVGRSLEKLRAILEQRGLRSSSAALGTLIAAHAVTAAPVGLPAAISAVAASAGAASPFVSQIFWFFMNAKMKAGIGALALAGASTGYLSLHSKNVALESEIARLEQERASRPEVVTEAAPQVDAAELERLRAQHSELMRLRGEVTRLKAAEAARQASNAAQRAASPAVQQQATEEQREEQMRQLAIAKMSAARAWGFAFQVFAEANEGKYPAQFEEASSSFPTVPDELSWAVTAPREHFEILYNGSIVDVANPSEAIVMRDREPFDLRPDGSARRTYLFADGHTEVYKAKDGNFEEFEKARLPKLKQNRQTASQ